MMIQYGIVSIANQNGCPVLHHHDRIGNLFALYDQSWLGAKQKHHDIVSTDHQNGWRVYCCYDKTGNLLALRGQN